MLLRLVKTAFTAACLIQLAHAQSSNPASGQLIPTASTTPAMNALTQVGCFSTPTPMVDHGPYIYQSSGNCQPICYDLQQPVMGLVNGTNCWCGPLLPPKNSEVSNSSCNTPCAGYDSEMCGGDNFWTVYLTGVTRNQIQNLDPASVSSAKSSSTGPSTVIITAGPTGTSHGKSSGGSTVGIAVGVVVGLVAIAGIVLGAFLWLRHSKRKEAEEEFNRQNAIANFVEGGKSTLRSAPSSNDSRLDPHVFAARRDSSGSIADNADYSRRILQVRNPDDF